MIKERPYYEFHCDKCRDRVDVNGYASWSNESVLEDLIIDEVNDGNLFKIGEDVVCRKCHAGIIQKPKP